MDGYLHDALVGVSRSLYDSARCRLDANIVVSYIQASARWADAGWDLTLRGRGSSLSDDNKRGFGQASLARALNSDGSIRLVARGTYDDMKNISPDYYSPQHLRLYELGPEYSKAFSKHLEFYVRYLPGYGQEQSTSGQLAQDLETHLRMHFSPTASLSPGFEYERTPTFYETIYLMEFKICFLSCLNFFLPSDFSLLQWSWVCLAWDIRCVRNCLYVACRAAFDHYLSQSTHRKLKRKQHPANQTFITSPVII